MTATRPNERISKQEAVLGSLKYDVTRALEHIQRELSNLNPEASNEPSDRRAKGAVADPVGRLATDRYEFTSMREDISDWIDGLENYIPSGRFLVDEALKMRTEKTELFDATEYGVRCRHAECEQWASDHRTRDRTVIHDWCDAHWLSNACHIHGTHEHDGRRVEGVRCCQNAYRQHQRETAKDVA